MKQKNKTPSQKVFPWWNEAVNGRDYEILNIKDKVLIKKKLQNGQKTNL